MSDWHAKNPHPTRWQLAAGAAVVLAANAVIVLGAAALLAVAFRVFRHVAGV